MMLKLILKTQKKIILYMTEISVGKITADDFDDLAAPYVLDLIAVFSQLKEDVLNELNRAVKENWTPDTLIKNIEELF